MGVFTRHESAARELQVISVTIHVDSGRQHHPVGGGGWSHTAGGPAPIHRSTVPDPPGDRPRSTGGSASIHRWIGPDPPGDWPDPSVDRPRSTGKPTPIHRDNGPDLPGDLVRDFLPSILYAVYLDRRPIWPGQSITLPCTAQCTRGSASRGSVHRAKA